MSSRQRKRQKNILREFSHLSVDELMLEIHDAVEKFVILTKSEEEAALILQKYNKNACFDFNEYRKAKYYKLMVCARLMNLVVPLEWYNVSLSDSDVVERIKEVMYDDVKWIDEYCYVYDCVSCEDEVLEETENVEGESEFVPLPSDIEIDKVIKFYNDIIEKEFGNTKKLVK